MKVTTCALLATLAIVQMAAAAIEVSVISDIHYDPSYGTDKGYGSCTTAAAAPLGSAGCDSPDKLVESLVADVSAQSIDYTIYAGDWQRHNMAAAGLQTSSVFDYLAPQLAGITATATLPEPRVMVTIGNNDVMPDYTFDVTAASQPTLEAQVDIMTQSALLVADEATEMRRCGFFSRNVGNGLTIISLHTLVWANTLQPALAEGNTDPCGQFAFLEAQIAAAKTAQRRVIILGHIAPTPDVYNIISREKFGAVAEDMYWVPAFQERYSKLLLDSSDVVVLQIFGHAHLFSIQALPSVGVPLVVVPAVSPVFGNSPSYFVASFTDKWELLEMRQRYLKADGTWSYGMSVTGALGLATGFGNATQMNADLSNLFTSRPLWSNYLSMHSGGGVDGLKVYPKQSCGAFCQAVTLCSMTRGAHDEIQQCVAEATAPAPVPVNLGGSIVTSVLILGVVFAVVIIMVLYQIVPKIRAGEMKLSNVSFDFRAQLLNEPTKKEKARRKAASSAAAQRRADREAAYEANADGGEMQEVPIEAESVHVDVHPIPAFSPEEGHDDHVRPRE